MSNGENHPNLKKQITSIAFVVGACLIGLIALLSYLGNSNLTPLVASHLLNINKAVETALKQDVEYNKLIDDVRKLAKEAAKSADKAHKSEQKVMAIKNEVKSQLKDVDTAYYKKYVFYNREGKHNTAATADKAGDTGIHFFADETQQVSIRCWCDIEHRPCKNTAFKVFLDQLNIFEGYPYYGTPTGKDLSIKEEHYLPASLFSRTEDEKGEQRKKKVIKVTTADINGPQKGERIDLFCWVYVRHKGVLCEKKLTVR